MFTFIESSAFERVRQDSLKDEEYSNLQQYMIVNPEAGAVVPGSGGCPKTTLVENGNG